MLVVCSVFGLLSSAFAELEDTYPTTPNYTYTATASTGLAICSNYSTVEQCPNMFVLPYGIAGLSAFASSEDSPYAIQNVLFENDQNFTDALCNFKDNDPGGLCDHSVVENCTSHFPFFLFNVFPTKSRIGQLRKMICGNRQKFDDKCVSSKMDEMLSCVNVSDIVYKAVNDTPVSGYTELMKNATCMTYALGRVCAPRILRDCGADTVKMYVEVIPSFPLDCQQAPDIVLPKTECSSTEGMYSVLNCFYKTSRYSRLLGHFSVDELMEAILNSLTFDDNDELCGNLDTYREALTCSLNVRSQCVTSALKPSVQDPDHVVQGLVTMCNNVHRFDSTCAQAAISNKCTQLKRSTIYVQTVLKHLCGDVSNRNQCLLSNVKHCGHSTSTEFGTILHSQLPKMCLTKGHAPVIG